MEKKKLTTKEIFCGMPFLQRYFCELERKIRIFTPEGGKCGEVEKLKEKRKNLLFTAKNMDMGDLEILYYLHRLQRVRPMQILNLLKKMSDTQDELSALVKEP